MSEWEKQHGPGSSYQLIEPMDGFHPNQVVYTTHFTSNGSAIPVWAVIYLKKNILFLDPCIMAYFLCQFINLNILSIN